jgi:hypothetical protein
LLQVSAVGLVPVQVPQLPAAQVWVPAEHSPTSVPQPRTRPSSICPSQSSSALLQISTPEQLQISPSSIWPSQLSSMLLQISVVGVAPGLVMLQVVPAPVAVQT